MYGSRGVIYTPRTARTHCAGDGVNGLVAEENCCSLCSGAREHIAELHPFLKHVHYWLSVTELIYNYYIDVCGLLHFNGRWIWCFLFLLKMIAVNTDYSTMVRRCLLTFKPFRIFVVGIGFFSLCFLMTSLGGQFSAKRPGDSPFTIRAEGMLQNVDGTASVSLFIHTLPAHNEQG
uniref:Uncharacterized protein n=1 Tax=Esox lucius TaxID=8010 RepID=A0AAY5KNJ3_ESOLU